MNQNHEGEGYEKQDVDGKEIIPFVWWIIAGVIVIVFWVSQYFFSEKDVLYDKIALAPEQQIGADVRAKDKKILNEYATLDKVNGVFRISISRAMALIVDESHTKRKEASQSKIEKTEKKKDNLSGGANEKRVKLINSH